MDVRTVLITAITRHQKLLLFLSLITICLLITITHLRGSSHSLLKRKPLLRHPHSQLRIRNALWLFITGKRTDPKGEDDTILDVADPRAGDAPCGGQGGKTDHGCSASLRSQMDR